MGGRNAGRECAGLATRSQMDGQGLCCWHNGLDACVLQDGELHHGSCSDEPR